MRKAAPLIIFEWIQFSGRTSSSQCNETFLAKQNSEVMPKWVSLVLQEVFLSLMKSLADTQTVFFSKQVLLIVAGRQRDAQTINILKPLHF